ncbi:hypothetical protein BH09PSE4_BH09PSE4_06920 [soil metagenome]
MPASVPDAERPFVETSIARLLRARLTVTHEERGITVISGPWGIGKTTALDAFEEDHEGQCVVVKIDPGSSKRGATPIAVMQLAIEAMRPLSGRSERATLSNAYWTLRQMVYDSLCRNFGEDAHNVEYMPRFTFIFDEAQFLSKDAIEMLRFWNDGDRGTTPFPVGLVFVGNNEFALKEDASGNSVLSGAVRSRLLFEEQLEYANVSDLDLTLFVQSRGITDPAAIGEFVSYFSRGRRRDLRNAERHVTFCKRRAGDGPVTVEIVRGLLSP